jgi:hypothetical protein
MHSGSRKYARKRLDDSENLLLSFIIECGKVFGHHISSSSKLASRQMQNVESLQSNCTYVDSYKEFSWNALTSDFKKSCRVDRKLEEGFVEDCGFNPLRVL